MSSNVEPPDPAAQDAADAAAAAALRMTIEAWTLYGIGMVITFLRTYARAKAVGFRNFRADDYLAWAAAGCRLRSTKCFFSLRWSPVTDYYLPEYS